MLISSLILSAALAAPPAAAAPGAEAYVGRWNVKLTDAEDTFTGAGFQIDSKDGGLAGALVWRWGSFAPVKSVELVGRQCSHLVREDEPGSPRCSRRGSRTACSGAGPLRRRQGAALRGPTGARARRRGRACLGRAGHPLRRQDARRLEAARPEGPLGWAVVNGELAVVEPWATPTWSASVCSRT